MGFPPLQVREPLDPRAQRARKGSYTRYYIIYSTIYSIPTNTDIHQGGDVKPPLMKRQEQGRERCWTSPPTKRWVHMRGSLTKWREWGRGRCQTSPNETAGKNEGGGGVEPPPDEMVRMKKGEVLNLPQWNSKNTGRGGVEPPPKETASTCEGEVLNLPLMKRQERGKGRCWTSPNKMVSKCQGEVLNLPLTKRQERGRGRCWSSPPMKHWVCMRGRCGTSPSTNVETARTQEDEMTRISVGKK